MRSSFYLISAVGEKRWLKLIIIRDEKLINKGQEGESSIMWRNLEIGFYNIFKRDDN